MSLQVLLLACWQVLICRWTGRAEVVVETAFDQRKYGELQGALGQYTNYLPLKSAFAESFSFADSLLRVGQLFAAAHEWQEGYSPELMPGGETGLGDRAADSIGYHYTRWPSALRQGEVTFSLLNVEDGSAPCKLMLACTERDDALSIELRFDPTRYRREDVELLKESYLTLLGGAAACPREPLWRLELLSEEGRRGLLEGWSGARGEQARGRCVHELFEEQAGRTPVATAVIHEGRQLTYQELDGRANQLAHYLRGSGVGAETVVGVLMERGVGVVIAMLGVLKAGGAYLPLHPSYPRERLRFMLEDAGARLLLTEDESAADSPAHGGPTINIAAEWAQLSTLPTSAHASGVGAENLACVLYTSGSDGRPEGVRVRHGAVVNLEAALREGVYAESHGGAGVSLDAPPSFDASVRQLVQLLGGHTLVVSPAESRAAAGVAAPPLTRAERGAESVLSFAQQRLWFIDQLEPGSALYNNPMAVRLSGELKKDALERTLTEIVRRHEVLRTTFQDGQRRAGAGGRPSPRR